MTDIDGREYIDFNAGWTVAGVGFSNPEVVEAVREEVALSAGLPGGTFPSETTVKFAEKLISDDARRLREARLVRALGD